MNIHEYMIDVFFSHYLRENLRIILKLFYERCFYNTFSHCQLFDPVLCDFLTPSVYKL
jgi:hypothetical protein